MINNQLFLIPNLTWNVSRQVFYFITPLAKKVANLAYTLFKSFIHFIYALPRSFLATLGSAQQLSWKINLIRVALFLVSPGEILGKAVEQDNEEEVGFYLRNGIDPSSIVNAGNTALHFAARRGQLEIVQLLLEKGAVLNIQNQSGQTALHFALASENENIEIVELLITKGIDIEIEDHLKRRAIHFSFDRGYKQSTDLLLEKGADISVKSIDGMTLLHYAAANSWNDIIDLLIKQSEDRLNALDCMGLTPACYAFKSGHLQLGNALKWNDSLTQDWISHKMISHRFGLAIKIQSGEQLISLDYFNVAIPSHVLLKSIIKLSRWQKQGPLDWEVKDTNKVLEAINQVGEFAYQKKESIEENICNAFALYQRNEIVILPVFLRIGEIYHACTAIFYKNYFIWGDRGIGTGLEVRAINNPLEVLEMIRKFFEGICQSNMEIHHLRFYLISNNRSSYSRPHQKGNTCCWSSYAKLAFQGALFVQLLKKGYTFEEAEEYSRKMYKTWSQEDRLDAIQDYINQIEESKIKRYVLACVYRFLSLKDSKGGEVNHSILDFILEHAPDSIELADQIVMDIEKREFHLKKELEV